MKLHKFNYVGSQNDGDTLWDSQKECTNIFIKITKIDIFLNYFIDNKPDEYDNLNDIIYNNNNKFVLCLVSTTNSAHSISEIISFIDFYKKNNFMDHVIINEDVKTYLPFIYQLLTLFIPENKIYFLSHNKLYKFTNLLIYNSHHFNCTNNWNSIPFIKDDNTLYFENLKNIKNTFVVDSQFLFQKIEEIYNTHKDKYKLYDNIMIVKFDNECATTPDRGFTVLSNEVKTTIEKNNINIISINKFQNIYEYICVLYHAKKVVFSYGGPCCTNRFFVNPLAEVIVLACKTYEYEYEYNNLNKNYWHVRSSHLCPVKKQTFLLNVDKVLTIEFIEKII